MRHVRAVFALISAAIALTGCKRSARESPHTSLTSIDPLRAAFNADSGKVRAIFLASPT